MTDFRDLPKINTLHTQQLQIIEAIEMLDDGGTLSNFTIAPRPDNIDTVANPAIPALPKVPVSLATKATLSEDLRGSLRDWLTGQLSDLNLQLADLGVTGNPTL